MKPVTDVNAKA